MGKGGGGQPYQPAPKPKPEKKKKKRAPRKTPTILSKRLEDEANLGSKSILGG